MIGFAHVYLYDRWGADADLLAVLAPYVAAGQVTRVPFAFFSPVQVRQRSHEPRRHVRVGSWGEPTL